MTFLLKCGDCYRLRDVTIHHPPKDLQNGDKWDVCNVCQKERDAEQDDEQAWDSFHAGPFERDPGADF